MILNCCVFIVFVCWVLFGFSPFYIRSESIFVHLWKSIFGTLTIVRSLKGSFLGGFRYVFYILPLLGKLSHLSCVFFKWVGKTALRFLFTPAPRILVLQESARDLSLNYSFAWCASLQLCGWFTFKSILFKQHKTETDKKHPSDVTVVYFV